MSTNTATIETLTAEVRVLRVGNRQVTNTLARQLDWVAGPDELTPFGRALVDMGKSPDGRPEGRCQVIIGRAHADGTLVLAEFPRYEDGKEVASGRITLPPDYGYNAGYDATYCSASDYPVGMRIEYMHALDFGVFDYDAVRLRVRLRKCTRYDHAGCPIPFGIRFREDQPYMPLADAADTLARHRAARVAQLESDRVAYEAAAALPLIVLAAL